MLTAEKLRNLINYYYFLARKYQGCLLNWLLGHSSFSLSLSPGSPELFLLGEESPTSLVLGVLLLVLLLMPVCPSTTVSEATEACRYQPLCQVPLWIICLRTLLQSFSLRNAQNVNLKIFKKNIVKYDTHSISFHNRKFYLLPLC